MTTILTLPGWMGSGHDHWQSRWERERGCRRIEQADWEHPRRDAWVRALDARLAEISDDIVLVAHSLGCALVAHWFSTVAQAPARHARVRGVLLVAPPDVERVSAPAAIRDFAPVPAQWLPVPATVVASTSDPYCGFMRSGLMATQWGAEFINIGNAGHINAESGLGDWEAGWALVARWL